MSITVTVDAEVEESDIEDAGYHHEDDCPALDVDVTAARQALSDWHDKAHGLTLWEGCPFDPCYNLPREFKLHIDTKGKS